jgi:squalene-hopene/tetraprenyl-beta-curcumene cyclase
MKHIKPRVFVSVLCTCLIAATMASGADETKPAGQSPDDQAKAAILRGLDWLKANQSTEGSWSNTNYPATTALALWAFARSEHPDRAAVGAKAASFIERFIQPDGGIYKPATGARGSGGLSTYNTAVCMVALHAWDRAKYTQAILAARKYIAGSQLTGDSPATGGFGYDPAPPDADPKKARADLSNTAVALRAMRVTQDVEDLRTGGKSVDVNWNASLAFIEKFQNRDSADTNNYGGFAYDLGGERGGTAVGKDGTVKLAGYGSMTYAGLESMIFAQVDRTDPRVRSALQWAAAHWSVDENPGQGSKGLFYYLNIMSKALSLNGSDTLARKEGEPIPWKSQLVGKLVAMQQKDGSWVNKDNTFWEGDAALVTPYSILALEMAIGR